ncbi:Aldehyde dehydrogenase domain - like 2 [Theobroma cacao]|nr:Aldehyde dehydrogenase domain - like 2 [Theobroma cacao]
METQNQPEFSGQKRMLPPPAGNFQDREELIKHVRDFGASQGYVVTIKKSRKDRRVILGCDRGGVYRNRRKIDESKRKRKACSRLINCPFEAIGKKEDDAWVLTIKNGEHNHEPLKDMSEHPYSRRFTEEEVRQIKLMTEAGIKPRQVLKALKQSNPELQSTPRHLYNLKAKIRQGNLSEKSFKSWRPNRSVPVSTNGTLTGELLRQNNQPVKVPNFIGGKFVHSQGSMVIDVINPATQEVVSQVPSATYEEFKDAVNAAKQAFSSWKNTPVATRQRIMFKLQELIHRNIDKLAMNITMEQGMTLKRAQGDVLRGLEVVEHACGLATLQMGEFVPNASNGIDTYFIREPLGVCAGICPSNFPAMIPLLMFPIAVSCGNTFILKPCEKNPGASMILAALAKEAGLPDGVLNIVHGTNDIVNYICDDEDIKAISFVGSNTAGMHIYARAAARGKRIQSNVGGKNYAIIMPDASIDATLSSLVAGGFGAAGQRCIGLSTAVFVGGSMPWEEELLERAKALKVNVGSDPGADVGPVISKEVKDRINRLVQSSVDGGARLVLDGRNIVVPGYENGNFIGPTIICDVASNMECCKEEIFGPVLLCMQAGSLEGAIAIVNRNKSVNGASIFTTSGYAARKFQNEIESGLVGINVPVPVAIPMPFSSFNGPRTSFAGDLNFCGKSGVHFYTQIKMVAQQWRDLPSLGLSSGLHLSSETDITSRGVSSALPPSSERDSPYRRVSRAMSPESEGNSPNHALLLSVAATSERDLSNPVITSLPPTADGDLPNHGASLLIPPTSEMDLENQDASLTVPLGRETSNQGVSSATSHQSERMYTSQTSQWNETPTLASQRNEPIPPPSERINIPTTSKRNSNAAPTVPRSDTAIGLTHERLYLPTSHKNDSMVPISHRNESMSPTSERIYMMATSHLSDSMGQTFQRTDAPMFPTSERMYVPATPHRTDHMGSTSQRADVALQPAAERLYMPATSQRNDNIASSSHRAESMPQNSEGLYLSPIIHRNAGMPPTSERLYMPAASQRMYAQNTIISMDDYPSQGPPMTLPTSQRI